ncbi:MAG: NAD(P)/FAD-dependent oxidoreductase [Candidatus Omnitrophota bacterium]
MRTYDIAVIGGGAAGCMAAIRAAQSEKSVALIERNNDIGRKILLSGKGRCNVTNNASIDECIERFGKRGRFLRSAFNEFYNEGVSEFFRSGGLKLKTERQGRVFPDTDRALSVVDVLRKSLRSPNIDLLLERRVSSVVKKDDLFELLMNGTERVTAKKVILATGGASFGKTGSTGDGYVIAKKLGHSIEPLRGALVPLKTKERWVKRLQGVALKNVRLLFKCGDTRLSTDIGECIFTHFGISGPLILDKSGDVVDALREHKEIALLIDMKPALDQEKLKKRLMREFKGNGTSLIKNIMGRLLPGRCIPVFLELAGIDPGKRVNQISREERHAITHLLKNFPLTITSPLALDNAMVTNGGVSTKEIDPRTMGSNLLPGLFFAGEIIDGCASSGGYNLQQAWSTGYLAGEKAASY